MLESIIPDPWKTLLSDFIASADFARLDKQVSHAYVTECVYPPKEMLFSALTWAPPEKVRVVILGQDPYHGAGEAHGLAFSVRNGTPIPPSLRNIFKELSNDISLPFPTQTELLSWAQQGVLLLNTVLTVRADTPASHASFLWHRFTDELISKLAQMPPQKVFILWGNHARAKASLIRASVQENLILESAHPSPLSASRGFFGSRPFSKTNAQLRAWHLPEIQWEIPAKTDGFEQLNLKF